MNDAQMWRIVEHYLPELAGLDLTNQVRFAACATEAVMFDDLRAARAQTPESLFLRFVVTAGHVGVALPYYKQERLKQLLYDENDARNGPLFAGNPVTTTDGEHFTVDADAAGEVVRIKDATGLLYRAERGDLRRMPSMLEPALPAKWCTYHNDARKAILDWTDDGVDDIPTTVDATIRLFIEKGMWPGDRCGMANAGAKDFAGAMKRRKRSVLLMQRTT